METIETLKQIQKDIIEIKTILQKNAGPPQVSEKWVPRSEVIKFFNYGDTQMATLEKSGDLVVTKVGRRVFIHRDSLDKLLNKNVIKVYF